MKKLPDKRFHSEDWTQVPPNLDDLGPTWNSPPFLPPHLSHNILNSTPKVSTVEPTILPEPISHVMLHHLYAQSIKDHLLVLASTARYRKKCVTIIYYTPIE